MSRQGLAVDVSLGNRRRQAAMLEVQLPDRVWVIALPLVTGEGGVGVLGFPWERATWTAHSSVTTAATGIHAVACLVLVAIVWAVSTFSSAQPPIAKEARNPGRNRRETKERAFSVLRGLSFLGSSAVLVVSGFCDAASAYGSMAAVRRSWHRGDDRFLINRLLKRESRPSGLPAAVRSRRPGVGQAPPGRSTYEEAGRPSG